MFGLFNKKTSFLDIWKGTPEIHCHVLPGIDDGSKDVASSKQLLEKYSQLGCSQVIATPHTMGGVYDNTPETIKKAYDQVQVPSELKLSYASEYMLDENFNELLSNDRLITLKDKYLLVEMSFFQPPENLKEVLYRICSKGYIPVIAHPERYAYYHDNRDVLGEFKRMGCCLQLNALSLTKHYGESVQKAAFEILVNNMFDFIGIDTHRLDHLNKIEEMEIPLKYKENLILVCANTQQNFLK